MLQSDIIEKFFSSYESRFNAALKESPHMDVDGTAKAFADFFVEASPDGVVGGKNDEEFREEIPKGFMYYREIGAKSVKIGGIEISFLNEIHVMVKINWQGTYMKNGTQIVITYDVIYFLQTLGNTPKIFAYITGDEQKVLKENGLG